MNVNATTAASWQKLQERFRRDDKLTKTLNGLDALDMDLGCEEKADTAEHAYLPYATDPKPVDPEWK